MLTEPAEAGGSQVQILPVCGDQLAAAGEVFAGSHADYPSFRHLFPDPARRARALRLFFTGTVRDALAFGAVDGAVAPDGRLLGVAVWLPPGAFPWSGRRKARLTPTMLAVMAVAPGSFLGFARLGANAERLHPRDRHWNLEAMGVAPSAQGRGVGSRLIRPGLARADAEGLACYLTTARGENVPFYQRFGFQVEADALPLVPGGPTHWGMRRPPGGLGQG
jgi:GNAT superfamily N-acetyltransferase